MKPVDVWTVSQWSILRFVTRLIYLDLGPAKRAAHSLARRTPHDSQWFCVIRGCEVWIGTYVPGERMRWHMIEAKALNNWKPTT